MVMAYAPVIGMGRRPRLAAKLLERARSALSASVKMGVAVRLVVFSVDVRLRDVDRLVEAVAFPPEDFPEEALCLRAAALRSASLRSRSRLAASSR